MNTYAHQQYIGTATLDAQRAAEELTTLIGGDPANSKPVVVMYFDESHALFDKTATNGGTYYDALLGALADLSMNGADLIFSVFLSTNSRLKQFAPTPGRMLSNRAQAEGHLAPFTELSFDCHPSFPIKESEWTMKEIVHLEFMCKFGRPLYVLLYF